MKLPILSGLDSLCGQCVALCCRYYALSIDKPTTRRDFDDIRWFILHEDTIVFVEDGEWYVQVNRKCRALLPDNRCGVYHNRPAICREYKTDDCDWHATEYDYDLIFTEPEQVEAYAKEYFAQQRKKKAKRPVKPEATKPRAAGRSGKGAARKLPFGRIVRARTD